MGRIEEGGWTVNPRSLSQSQTQIECCWQSRNHRSDEEAMGGDPQSAESSSDGPGEEKDVTGTKGSVAGKFGTSTSGQGSEEGGSSVNRTRIISGDSMPGSSHAAWRVIWRRSLALRPTT
jgi:hypothetical protein